MNSVVVLGRYLLNNIIIMRKSSYSTAVIRLISHFDIKQRVDRMKGVEQR